jgi:hypothetical protein
MFLITISVVLYLGQKLSLFKPTSFSKNRYLCGEIIHKECPYHRHHHHPRLMLNLIIIIVIFAITCIAIFAIIVMKKEKKKSRGVGIGNCLVRIM